MSRVTSNIFVKSTSGHEIWGGQYETLFFQFLKSDYRQTFETCRDNNLSIFHIIGAVTLLSYHFRSTQEVIE